MLLFAASISYAFSQSPLRLNATNEYMDRIITARPDTKGAQNNIELHINNTPFDEKIDQQGVTIPIVFHLLYTNETELMPLERVFSQLEALNRDFNPLPEAAISAPPDEKEYYKTQAFPHIGFCLPETDEHGKPTTGIIYYNTATADWDTEDAIKNREKGGVQGWNTQKYLNIWVAKLKDGIGGYAQMPGGPAEQDGIVIDYRLLGRSESQKDGFNEGKFLTHLIGNYLGLYSLWGPAECTDDKVYDTPIHNAPNFGAPSPTGHISLCAGYRGEMWMNFMDCTDDSLRVMFTKGQKQRMYALLSNGGARSKLLETPVKCGIEFNKERSNADITGQLQISAFPNPAKERIFIQVTGETTDEIRLDVFNSAGQRVFFSPNIHQNLSFNCTGWLDGLYYLVFSQAGETINTQKITILH